MHISHDPNPHPIKKCANKKFLPIAGSGDGCGDKQKVLCTGPFYPQRDFYVKVFNLLHMLRPQHFWDRKQILTTPH